MFSLLLPLIHELIRSLLSNQTVCLSPCIRPIQPCADGLPVFSATDHPKSSGNGFCRPSGCPPETDSAGHPDILRKQILQIIRMSSGNGFCRSSGYPPEHKERPVRSHRSLDAGGGARTHTPFLTTDFESVSSANSDTPAQEPLTAAPYRLYHLICFLSNRRRALCFFCLFHQLVKRTILTGLLDPKQIPIGRNIPVFRPCCVLSCVIHAAVPTISCGPDRPRLF